MSDLAGDMRWMLALPCLLLSRLLSGLLPRLLDTWVLLEGMLLNHSGLLWWTDLSWSRRAHLDACGTACHGDGGRL